MALFVLIVSVPKLMDVPPFCVTATVMSCPTPGTNVPDVAVMFPYAAEESVSRIVTALAVLLFVVIEPIMLIACRRTAPVDEYGSRSCVNGARRPLRYTVA